MMKKGQKYILVGQTKNYYISYSLKKNLEVINKYIKHKKKWYIDTIYKSLKSKKKLF